MNARSGSGKDDLTQPARDSKVELEIPDMLDASDVNDLKSPE